MYRQALLGTFVGLIGWTFLRSFRTRANSGQSKPETCPEEKVNGRERREEAQDSLSADSPTLRAAALAARLRMRKALDEHGRPLAGGHDLSPDSPLGHQQDRKD